MTPDETKGYEVLLRIAAALEGVNEQLCILNDEGLVVFGGAVMEEN